MKKIVSIFSIVLTLLFGVSQNVIATEIAQNECVNSECAPCDTSFPCPQSCDPCTPTSGTNCRMDLCYLGVAAILVAGAAAIILTSNHDPHHSH